MLTVKCPKCAAALRLAKAPAGGRVKCPKCSAVIAVNPQAGAATGTAALSGARPAPQRRPAGPADPDDENFDFGRIAFPTAANVAAVSHFPSTGGKSVYQGPIPGDPLEMAPLPPSGPLVAGRPAPQPVATTQAAASSNGGKAKKSKQRMSTGAMIRMIIGLILLVICSIIAAVVWQQRMNRGPSMAESIAQLQTTAPADYRAVGIQGVIVLMPKGNDYDNLPSAIECLAMETNESNSVYFLGAMNGGTLALDADQMKKKAGRQLGGEILGGQPVKRNGYEGIKGILDGSIFLPRMKVEIYHVDERFVILGCAPRSMSVDPTGANSALEAEEQKVFYDSFKIGPKPAGFF